MDDGADYFKSVTVGKLKKFVIVNPARSRAGDFRGTQWDGVFLTQEVSPVR